MAIARGAGTEILRSQLYESQDNAPVQIIIKGVQHHIYTVISCTFHSVAVATDRNWITMYFVGYDAKAGTSAAAPYFFKQDMSAFQTFVWNDKFSFNGYEPSGTAVLSAAVQILNAAQGGSADAELMFKMTDADGGGQDYDVLVTYLDQDWS